MSHTVTQCRKTGAYYIVHGFWRGGGWGSFTMKHQWSDSEVAIYLPNISKVFFYNICNLYVILNFSKYCLTFIQNNSYNIFVWTPCYYVTLGLPPPSSKLLKHFCTNIIVNEFWRVWGRGWFYNDVSMIRNSYFFLIYQTKIFFIISISVT